MADLGLQNSFGQEAVAQQVRQRIFDQLQQQQQQHQMSVEDQRLELERQRLAQETADRQLLRQQQGQTFNETLAEKTAANLGPNQTIISPELAQKFASTSLAPLVKPDQTLPSTQLSAGVPLAPTLTPRMAGPQTTEITPSTQVAGTAPTVTQKPSVLTGQLRFMGTPAANDLQRQRDLNTKMTSDVTTSGPVRGFLRANPEAKGVPYELFKDQAPEALQETVGHGGKPTLTPRSQAAGMTPYHPPAASATPQSQSDAKAIALAIMSGDQPPDTRGLFRLAGPVRAELAANGYNLTNASLDWEATKKHLATLNGTQQTRLRQAISTASDSLDVIQNLADRWDAGRFPILNSANLTLAKNGAYGRDAASIATQLEGQITDVTSELGNVYMGGGSPTDHALQLAGKNLSANWDRKVLTDMIELARKNLQIRQNSITNAGPVTSSNPTPAVIAPPATAPARKRYNPATGQIE